MGLLPPSSAHSNPDTSFAPGALVLFENNSEAVLATILRDSKKKLVVLSERGREVELGANRLLPVLSLIHI